MRRTTLGVLSIMAIAVTGLVAPSNIATADPDGWYRWRGQAAMISNYGLYRSREFIYQDYIYDDHGPNTDGVNHTDVPLGGAVRGNDPTNPRLGSSGGQVRHAGDFMYAADGTGYYANAADLIEFRVARNRDGLHYQFRLGALVDPDSTVIGMCVDQDGRRESGLVTWPFEAGLAEALGCDTFYTLHGSEAAVTNAAGTTTNLAELGGEARVDLDENTLELRVPLAVADPGSESWRYYVASGLWDGNAQTWYDVPPLPSTPGAMTPTGGGAEAPRIWDLLSNNHEPNTYWREERQADDLARGSIEKHFVDVDFGRLAQPLDDPDPRLTGVVDRIYVTRHPMEPNEGISFEAVALGPRNYIYYGDYQPYAVVIPKTYWQQLETNPQRRFPLDLCLHPLNGNHHVEIYYQQVEAERNYVPGVTGTTAHTGYLGFSEIENQTDRQNLVYACVNGRGEGMGYSGGDGMVDALEVLSDVQEHYRVDPDRKTLHGISLGAIGTWYMATLYPDAFSAALPSIFTGSTDHLANLYNLPTFYTIGTFDQFGQGALGDAVADSMEALGNEYLYYHHLGRFHELSLGAEALPISEPLFYNRRRVTNPARVRYVYDPDRYSSKIPGDGSVYWVSGIAPREGRSATIDVSSFGRADELPTDQVIFTGLYENTAQGYQVKFRGLLRMAPEEFQEVWKPGQFQAGWRELSLSVEHTELPVEEVSNGFRLEAAGLESVSLDLRRMKVAPRREIVATIDHDGALALTLLGRFSTSTRAFVDGEPVPVSIVSNGITVHVPAADGAVTLELRRS